MFEPVVVAAAVVSGAVARPVVVTLAAAHQVLLALRLQAAPDTTAADLVDMHPIGFEEEVAADQVHAVVVAVAAVDAGLNEEDKTGRFGAEEDGILEVPHTGQDNPVVVGNLVAVAVEAADPILVQCLAVSP